MPRPCTAPLVSALLALTAFAAVGCSSPPPNRTAAPDPYALHPGGAGGADVGPLTDARGDRRSLAFAPAGVTSEGGWYADRNDGRRAVTAGFRSPTFQTAQTYTVDRGPGGAGRIGRGSARGIGSGLRDGFSTRTIRRSFSETVR